MITENYRKIMSQAHSVDDYGKRNKIPKQLVKYIAEKSATSVLDFGCGKGRLRETFQQVFPKIKYHGYDPCVPEFNTALPNVDLIFSTDVLEHVEPSCIDETLKEIYEHCRYTYHLISCAPAKLVLADGRNAHLIQESPDWWKQRFTKAGFKITFDHYKAFTKWSKQLKKEMPVKELIILAERNG